MLHVNSEGALPQFYLNFVAQLLHCSELWIYLFLNIFKCLYSYIPRKQKFQNSVLNKSSSFSYLGILHIYQEPRRTSLFKVTFLSMRLKKMCQITTLIMFYKQRFSNLSFFWKKNKQWTSIFSKNSATLS